MGFRTKNQCAGEGQQFTWLIRISCNIILTSTPRLFIQNKTNNEIKSVTENWRNNGNEMKIFYIVVYLPQARKVEPQNQPFLTNTRTNNGTVGLHDPFLGYSSVNTLPRRCMTSHSNCTGWESCDFSMVRYSWHNNRTELSVQLAQSLYNATLVIF
jgi:hypothetical protein